MRAIFCVCLCLAVSASVSASAWGAEHGVLAGLFGDHAQQDAGRVDFGRAGSWTFQTYGSAALGNSRADIFTAHVGAGYYLQDDLSINLELLSGQIDINEGVGGSASVFGADLLLRYHFRKQGPWTVYFDVGAGLQQSSRRFPIVGTHFNFRPQGGFGFTLDLFDNARLMTGIRWLHVSNANKDGSLKNPGYDAALIYSGLMVPF